MNRTLNQPTQSSRPYWRTAMLAFLAFFVMYAVFCGIKGSMNLYPNFSTDVLIALFSAFCLMSITWWLAALIIWSFKYKKHIAIKILSVVFAVISIFTTASMGTFLMSLNLSSDTGNKSHYLVVDKQVTLPEKALELFPKTIPQDAKEVQYHYSYCSNIPTFLMVQGQWTLEENAYNEEVTRIKSLLSNAEVLTDEQGTITEAQGEVVKDSGIILHEKGGLYFYYNDEMHMVRYMYSPLDEEKQAQQ